MSLWSKAVELKAQRFEEAMRRTDSDVDLLSVEEVECGLVEATDNWRSPWHLDHISRVFGCTVTVTEPDSDDHSGPRAFVYHIGNRHFRKMGRYISHEGTEIDEYDPVVEVYRRTYQAVVHEWAEV